MVEKFDQLLFSLQIVAFNLTELGHKLEALSLVECVLHFKRGGLQLMMAFVEQANQCFGDFWHMVRDLRRPINCSKLKQLVIDIDGGWVIHGLHAY